MVEMQEPATKTTVHKRKPFSKTKAIKQDEPQPVADDSMSNHTHQSVMTVNTVHDAKEDGKKKAAPFDLV